MNGIGYGITPFMGSHGILARSSGGGVTPFVNEYSMSFDGVDEYAKGSTTFSELNGQSKMTLSCWVKPTLNSTDEVLSCGYASGVLFQLRIYSSGIVRFQLNTTSFYTTTGGGAISANVWSHILICIDKTQASNADRGRIFINGVEGQTNNLDTSLIGTSNTPLYIGIGYGLTLPYGGSIDEVAMWVGSDERANISDIYNGGVPFDLSTLATPPSHWWRMGDGDSWDGSKWTLNDNIGSYNLDSVNMEEGDRVTDVP